MAHSWRHSWKRIRNAVSFWSTSSHTVLSRLHDAVSVLPVKNNATLKRCRNGASKTCIVDDQLLVCGETAPI